MWLVALLVPDARSPCSSRATLRPLRAASRATPAPVIPPPMTTRSSALMRPSRPPCPAAPSVAVRLHALARRRGRSRLTAGHRGLRERVAVDPVEVPLLHGAEQSGLARPMWL